MTTITLCVSPEPYLEKIAGGDRNAWANMYRNLVPAQMDEIAIADAVYKGHIIAPLLDGWRSYKHFISGQHIGIDLDTEDQRSEMGTLIKHDLVQMYGAIIYPTPSSQPTAPRSRVIFLLDQPITDPYKYKAAIRTLTRYFDGADIGSAEPTRSFFGNASITRTDGVWFSESCFPLDDLRQLYVAQRIEDKRHRQPTVDYTGHAIDVDRMVKTMVARAADGSRNNACYWMACRLVEDGVPDNEQEQAVRQFAEGVTHGNSPFTADEALACLRSARSGS